MDQYQDVIRLLIPKLCGISLCSGICLIRDKTYLIFFFTAEEDSMLPFNDNKYNKCSFDNLKTTVPKDC